MSLSAFAHLWNVIGFPDLFYDEGVYMRRAMHVISGLGLQERYFYDHPYFGQLFLAGTLSAVGYPNSLHPTLDSNSIGTLYLVPRMLMGLLAIADTFLIFQISEKRYNTKTAIAASLLFAVMPMTWITRRILLDSILLPFLLLSILLAIYSKDSKHKSTLVLLSGICMGLVLFTKVDMVIMLPLLIFLVYKSAGLRKIGLWFIPVILIPLIWPIESIMRGEFNLWLDDIMWQTGRGNGGLPYLLGGFFIFDPVLFLLGFAGIAYSVIKREILPILWCAPFLILFSLINYVQYFYWMPVIPILCIAGGQLIMEIKKPLRSIPISYMALTAIAVFGIVSTTLLITANISSQVEAIAFVAKYADENKNATVISSPVYSWIFYYVFHDKNVFADYRDLIYCPIPTKNIVLVADPPFQSNIGIGRELSMVYGNTTTIKEFSSNLFNYDSQQYPFTNLRVNYDGDKIDIRTSDKPIDTGVPMDTSARNICLNYFD
ncbi:MAG: glycosyltransferase family 39 protein [Thaumarchaeota archaeon]|nr:glycosyltransferase family 39 protein [Nitrososphaerota archaeon]